MKYRVALHDTETFLTDNGSEFIHDEFIILCEILNISINTTGGGSLWSNGIFKQHNLMLSEMVNMSFWKTAVA